MAAAAAKPPKRLKDPNNPFQTGIFPQGTDRPAVPNPTTAEAMASTDNTYGTKARPGVIGPDEDPKTAFDFPKPVTSWDVHHYFDSEDPEQVREALELREKCLKEFPNITVNPAYRAPVGPHEMGNWEAEIHLPSQQVKYLAWLVVNHGNIVCLVHPNTGMSGVKDHSVHATWVGKPTGNELRLYWLEAMEDALANGKEPPPLMGKWSPDGTIQGEATRLDHLATQHRKRMEFTGLKPKL